MLEYLRENYSQIITLAFIILCIVLIIISFFEKDDQNKKEFNLVLFKEKKIDNENVKNSNTYALFRKYLLIYQIYLYNNDGKEIFYSNIYPSLLKASKDISNIKAAIATGQVIYQTTIQSKHYAIFFKGNKIYGYTRQFDTLEDLDTSILEIKKLRESDMILEPYFDKSIELFDRSNKPTKIKNIEIIKIGDNYKISLLKNDQVYLESFESNDKNLIKELFNQLEEALINKRIFIENKFGKYRFIILSKDYKILCFGSFNEEKAQCIKEINEIYDVFK